MSRKMPPARIHVEEVCDARTLARSIRLTPDRWLSEEERKELDDLAISLRDALLERSLTVLQEGR